MLLQGVICDITEREKYTKMVVAVESGYESKIYLFRVDPEKLQETFRVGACVLLCGKYSMRDNCKRFILDSIVNFEFRSCELCKLPLSSERCFMDHNKEIVRVTGQWEILQKIYTRGNIELFLHRDGLVFSVSVSNNSWLYPVVGDICRGDFVIIDGWRQREKSKLIFCRKIENPPAVI